MILSDDTKMISLVNHHCDQEAGKILPVCLADERTVNCSGGSAATMKDIRRYGRETNYRVLKPCAVDNVRMFPRNVSSHCPGQEFSPE
jgi:hypothetical protein